MRTYVVCATKCCAAHFILPGMIWHPFIISYYAYIYILRIYFWYPYYAYWHLFGAPRFIFGGGRFIILSFKMYLILWRYTLGYFQLFPLLVKKPITSFSYMHTISFENSTEKQLHVFASLMNFVLPQHHGTSLW